MKIMKYPLSFYLTNATIRYYVTHPDELFRSRFNSYRLKLLKTLHKDINFKENISSNLKLDIVIPAIDRDLEVLTHVIDSIRINIKHPIQNIIIIAPNSLAIKKLCKEKKCVYLFEDTILPIKKRDIKYHVNGMDRSGWIYQQLLKWSWDTFSKSKYVLIAESDTVITRPQIFEYNKKIILTCGDKLCHIPYWEMYKRLFGEKAQAIYNFTSHHLLFERSKLQEAKRKIEKNCGMPWYKAIIYNLDKHETSSISDYDTYGQYVWKHYAKEYLLEDYFNLSLKRKELTNAKKLIEKYGDKYKTVSFHIYEND